ncbi:MAG: SGNH/GDSL hydrolase family protein [Myxococcales bacterium]|nr:SGNH/GDSL hydrolase family protein [Myxococcales bacterium]
MRPERTGTSELASAAGPGSSVSSDTSTDAVRTTGDDATSDAHDGRAILFVGNSYTAGNDLAGLVEALASADGAAPVAVEVIAVAGETMAGHLSTPSTLDAITTGDWDLVVLQGQSVEPMEPGSDFHSAATSLADVVVDAGAAVVLFETWARADGDALYQQPWYGPDPAAAQAKLRAAYQAVADSSGGRVAPVGDAWERAWTEAPELPLYAGDGSHATIHGSYLAACVLLEALTERRAVDNPFWPDALTANEAATLQALADAATP